MNNESFSRIFLIFQTPDELKDCHKDKGNNFHSNGISKISEMKFCFIFPFFLLPFLHSRSDHLLLVVRQKHPPLIQNGRRRLRRLHRRKTQTKGPWVEETKEKEEKKERVTSFSPSSLLPFFLSFFLSLITHVLSHIPNFFVLINWTENRKRGNLKRRKRRKKNLCQSLYLRRPLHQTATRSKKPLLKTMGWDRIRRKTTMI